LRLLLRSHCLLLSHHLESLELLDLLLVHHLLGEIRVMLLLLGRLSVEMGVGGSSTGTSNESMAAANCCISGRSLMTSSSRSRVTRCRAYL
jgi:hypothetical protein